MTPSQRAERIVQVARANPGSTLADLAAACDRSEKWTRKVLREAGVTFFEAPETQKPTLARSPRSIKASETRLVKKLINDARASGCVFVRTPGLCAGGTHFFEVQCPDDATRDRFEPLIRQYPMRFFDLLYPAPPRWHRRKKVCLICKAGSGCRKRGLGPGHELICEACHHTCQSHYPAETSYYGFVTPGGCYCCTQPGDDPQDVYGCLCAGWPEADEKKAVETQQSEIELEDTYQGPKERAKRLRATLKENFPGVKFSVHFKSYAGGDTIYVRWGEAEVGEIDRGGTLFKAVYQHIAQTKSRWGYYNIDGVPVWSATDKDCHVPEWQTEIELQEKEA